MNVENKLIKIYKRLFAHFGPQHWWPGQTRFEIIAGAILTQSAAWKNVEKAIVNIKKEKLLNPIAMSSVSITELASLIRPSGYFNQKAKKLINFIHLLNNRFEGSLNNMSKMELYKLREELLKVNGIGPETADSILLYAFNKPVFVVDAYTKRIFSRHGFIKPDADYNTLQQLFMKHIKAEAGLFNEYHALIVMTGKHYCKKQNPQCDECPLKIFL